MLETIEVKRDCSAIAVPSGLRQVIRAGMIVRLMQSRGGSYTVSDPSHAMFRVDTADADALGFQAPAQSPSKQQGPFSEELVWNALRSVYDPEIPVNIVDLGLVYSCEIHSDEAGHSIGVRMSMTAPGCGMGNVLRADVEGKLSGLPGVTRVNVEIIFDPPWTMDRMSEAARLELGLDLGSQHGPRLTQIY